MSKFSPIGMILLISSLILFVYQAVSAFLGMGTSDEFVYQNIRLVDILDEKYYGWINHISFVTIQTVAETIIDAPLALWLLCGAVFFFLIHAFTSKKQIRK